MLTVEGGKISYMGPSDVIIARAGHPAQFSKLRWASTQFLIGYGLIGQRESQPLYTFFFTYIQQAQIIGIYECIYEDQKQQKSELNPPHAMSTIDIAKNY